MPPSGKNADDPAVFQPVDCAPNRFAIGPIARGRKSVNRSQKQPDDWQRKEFGHRHPIDFPSHRRRDDERIEMTDMI